MKVEILMSPGCGNGSRTQALVADVLRELAPPQGAAVTARAPRGLDSMPTHRARVRRAVRRTATSLGELISAIYDGLQGPPSLRADQTARVLASPALARRLSRPIRLTA